MRLLLVEGIQCGNGSLTLLYHLHEVHSWAVVVHFQYYNRTSEAGYLYKKMRFFWHIVLQI